MLISQLARSVGVDPQTIRFYERQGLLPSPDIAFIPTNMLSS